MLKKIAAAAMAVLMICQLTACGESPDDNTKTEGISQEKTEDTSQEETEGTQEEADSSGSITTNLEKIDMSKWMYHAEDNVYYQIGISYCEMPADASYETLAVFVPGDYLSGTDNGDGTYTCEINSEAEVNGYTAEAAPIVMPIETPGYAAQAALTDYTSLTEYMEAGLYTFMPDAVEGMQAHQPALRISKPQSAICGISMMPYPEMRKKYLYSA